MRLYIHFPFCLAKCPYCDFYSLVAEEATREAYLEALLAEALILRRERPGDDQRVESVYCGGGTPSMFTPAELGHVLDGLRELWEIPLRAEITVEINPATWSGEQLEEAVSFGFNRFSIGAQSFDDEVLAVLGRQHDAADAFELAGCAARIPGVSMSLDLIYAVPGQTRGKWEETLEVAMELEPRHVSAYALSLDPSTPMGIRVGSGELVLPDEGAVVRMYEGACMAFRDAGLRHYEISNFAYPGWECAHNMAYWKREEYLGIGASAHSFSDNGIRRCNVKNVSAYMESVLRGVVPAREEERLGAAEAWEEEVMLSLRTAEGIGEDVLAEGCRSPEGMGEAWEAMKAAGLAWSGEGRRGLTERGMFVSNHIIAGILAG